VGFARLFLACIENAQRVICYHRCFRKRLVKSEELVQMKQLNPGGLVVACLVVLACSPVFANTIAVTNTNDSGPGSLRDAIASAASGDTINST
jgi:hypothetical protein